MIPEEAAAGGVPKDKVPVPTLERLTTYLRCLIDIGTGGVETISSGEIERQTGINAAQFRKDLSYFGEFGKRGIGYDVRELHHRIAQLLRISEHQNVLLIGAGHLGSALIAYPGWHAYRFRIAAVFDTDPGKIGTTIRRLPVRDFSELESVNESIQARIGILAIPAAAAQPVADRLIAAGVTGLINFAPVKLQVPERVVVREVCFICELAVLSHLIHADTHAEGAESPAPDPVE